ncbi:MAG TPA: HIT domain-containing protein [Candidatus Babeliales bacterium]|nr:HIT domain-containing protein [Candidatus Babeliales bacterium]
MNNKIDTLYAPWRNKYVKKNTKEHIAGQHSECVFCDQFTQTNDEKHYILKRLKSVAIILNLYPYNAGHLMVIPYDHKANLYDLNIQTQHELIEVVSKSSQILMETLKCQGINIGLNLGRAAGAGQPGHLHMHVLPRWEGDTNWLPVLAHTKQISIDIEQIYQDLKPHFDSF